MGIFASLFGKKMKDGKTMPQPALPAPAYDIDRILAETNASKVVSALTSAITAARTGKQMIAKERYIFHAYEAHWRILWDGIEGTLLEIGLRRLSWAQNGMEQIGAANRARILKEAVDSFGSADEIKQRTQKSGRWKTSPEQESLFEKLSSEYIDAEEDFDGLVVRYVTQHIEEFRSYQNRV